MEVDCTFGFSLYDKIDLFFSLTYGLTTVILYGLLAHAIMKRKLTRQPFYLQFVFLSLVCSILWLCDFFIDRLIPSSLLCKYFYPLQFSPLFLKPIMILYYTGIIAQMLTIMLINVNRMIMLVGVHATKPTFWDNNAFALLLGVAVSSVLLGSPFWGWGVSIEFVTGELFVHFQDAWPHIIPNYVNSALALICLTTIFVSTAVSLHALWRHPVNTRQAEIRLFFTSLAFSVSTLLFLICTLMYLVFYYIYRNEDVVYILVHMRRFMYDVACLPPAWMLFASNRQIRGLVFDLFKCSTRKNAVASIQSTTRMF